MLNHYIYPLCLRLTFLVEQRGSDAKSGKNKNKNKMVEQHTLNPLFGFEST